jgi:hypothetical protein
MPLITRRRRSGYAAERNARFLHGSGLAFCSVRRRIAASVFQLGDLEGEQRNAYPGDWSGTTQLCQPCFQGDLALGDNAVFRFHSLELNYQSFSVRHARCQLADYGYFVYLLLV